MDLTQRKKGISPLMYIILFLVFLASMNVINRYYVFLFIALGVFFLKPQRKLYLDRLPILLLFVLGLSWVLFSPDSTNSIFGIIKPFAYLLCYIMGCAMIRDDMGYSPDQTPYNLFYKTVLSVAAGTFFHYIANWALNVGASNRNTVDVWSRVPMAATGQAALACLPLGLAIACLFSKTGKKTKIAAIVTILLILGYNLILSGRTLVIMFLTITAIGFLHKLSTFKKGKLRLIVIVLAIILLVLFVYQTNLFNIRSYIESSPIYERFFAENSATDLNEDGRMRKKMYHLRNMDRYPFGGAHIRDEIGHSHDIILDTYDEAGIFALIGMVGYLIVSIVHLVKCVRNKSLPFAFRNTVLCVYAIVYLEFMVEPILQGMPWLFAIFCLIDGYVYSILSHNRMINPKVR